MECKQCGSIITGKGKVFCSRRCAVTYNNKHRVRKDAKLIRPCRNCGKGNKNKIYCSNKCQGEHKSKEAYVEFVGAVDKEYSDSFSPKSFKKFILKEQNCKCAICGISNEWGSGELVFILDHIDGNSSNNNRNNLRLVCPNCDSQLPTFKSRNKGNGRFFRKKRREAGLSY